MSDPQRHRILGFATQGDGHLDAARLRELLEPLDADFFPFEKARKLRSALALARSVRSERPSLVVMEGTGVAGGLTLLALDALLGVPFVFSSGDAVGPYLGMRSRLVGLLGGLYERALCRRCAGYVGWTPYLVGRAITLGARRAMTAPGWRRESPSHASREEIRETLGIRPDALLVGLVGSLNWNGRARYTYGAELVRAIGRVERADVIVCVVGDGPGRARLEEMAGDELGKRVLLPGRVAPSEVGAYLAAFDVASLPQSVDRVGAFRYSTKLGEYLAAGLPIITGQVPAAYDLELHGAWRLPGDAPWSSEYIDALAKLLETLTSEQIAARRGMASGQLEAFEKSAQQQRVSAFLRDILSELPG